MNVGDRFHMRRQEFECVAVATTSTAAGPVRHLSLRSICADCGASFAFTLAASDVPKRLVQCKCDRCLAQKVSAARTTVQRLADRRSRGERLSGH